MGRPCLRYRRGPWHAGGPACALDQGRPGNGRREPDPPGADRLCHRLAEPQRQRQPERQRQCDCLGERYRPGVGQPIIEPSCQRERQPFGFWLGNRSGHSMPDPECLSERVAEPVGEYVAERESQRFGQRLRVPRPLGWPGCRRLQPCPVSKSTMEPLRGTTWLRRISSSARMRESCNTASSMLSRRASSPIRTQSFRKGKTRGRTRLAR